MNDQSIGNGGQDAGQIGSGYGYVPAAAPAGVVSPFINDSMSVSEASTNRSNDLSDPSNPRLQKPTYAEIAMQFQLGMAQIVTNMLTQWNKSIQDEAERVKEELSSPAYQMKLLLNSSTYIAEADIKAGKDLTASNKNASEQQAAITTGTMEQKSKIDGLQERYNQLTGLSNLLSVSIQNLENSRGPLSNAENHAVGPNSAGYSPEMVMAASLAIGAGSIATFTQVLDVSSTSQVEVKTIQDAWNGINSSNDQLTQNGGWFSAMWGIGLVYQLAAQNVVELGAGHEKGPHKNLEFAKGYAQTLLNSLEGNAFNSSLMALLTPMIDKSPEAKAQQNPEMLAAKGKLVLLALALALVHKLEIKSVNPNAQIDESHFAAMLKGDVDFSRDDTFETAELKRQLVFNFQYTLQSLPESERVKVIEGILAYVSKQTSKDEPGVEGLLDQQGAFSDILADGKFEQSTFDKKPIDS